MDRRALEAAYLNTLANSNFYRDQAINYARSRVFVEKKQRLACVAARECDKKDGPTFVGYGGARGGGKSFWSLAQTGVDDCQRCPGLEVLFLRNIDKSANESLNRLRQDVLHHIPHRFKSTTGEIFFENGAHIRSGHFRHDKDIDAYLGQQYDVIILEEATLLKSSKFNDIKTVLRTNKKNWRPRMYLTTNPGNVGHTWFKRLFIDPYKQKKEKETRFIPATVDDNPNVNEEYTGILDTLTGWKYKAWRFGDWDISQGQFFNTFNDDFHVKIFDVQPHWDFWLGFDYGKVHNQAVILLARDGDGHIYVIDEHIMNQRLPVQHVGYMDGMLGRHGLTRSNIDSIEAGHDVFASTHQEKTISDSYSDLGYRLGRASIDRINGAGELLQLLGDPNPYEDRAPIMPRITFHPRCVMTIASIKEMIHDPKRPDDVLKVDYDPESTDIGDDPYDALRYGVMKYRSAGALVEAL